MKTYYSTKRRMNLCKHCHRRAMKPCAPLHMKYRYNIWSLMLFGGGVVECCDFSPLNLDLLTEGQVGVKKVEEGVIQKLKTKRPSPFHVVFNVRSVLLNWWRSVTKEEIQPNSCAGDKALPPSYFQPSLF